MRSLAAVTLRLERRTLEEWQALQRSDGRPTHELFAAVLDAYTHHRRT